MEQETVVADAMQELSTGAASVKSTKRKGLVLFGDPDDIEAAEWHRDHPLGAAREFFPVYGHGKSSGRAVENGNIGVYSVDMGAHSSNPNSIKSLADRIKQSAGYINKMTVKLYVCWGGKGKYPNISLAQALAHELQANVISTEGKYAYGGILHNVLIPLFYPTDNEITFRPQKDFNY
jgi:hypothetical protein